MRCILNIASSDSNPSREGLMEHFFQDFVSDDALTSGVLQPRFVYFKVNNNPFDPRLGVGLAFFIKKMERIPGRRFDFALFGVVLEPGGGEQIQGKNIQGRRPLLHKAKIVYNPFTKHGQMHIRD